MENSVLKQFTFNYKEIVIDEIALEGLEGIGLDILWRRIEKRISSPVTSKMKNRLWSFIVNNDAISTYELPEPRPRHELVDRFSLVNPSSGQLVDPPECPDGPYEYVPIKDEYGSCAQYKTRKPLNTSKLKTLSYEEVFDKYNDTLVLVASIEERWKALAPHKPITLLKLLTPLQYCMLELTGRARENGQTTIGKSNFLKIFKDSKLLYYNRKHLQNLDLVKVQSIPIQTGRALLVRLKRFYKPCLMTLPKEGLIYNIINNILEQPDQTDTTDAMLKKGIMKSVDWKRIIKTNLFKCEKRSVFVPEKKKTVERRFVSLNNNSDESSQSDEEEDSLPCQYKVKVGLARQAYERIVDSKERGLTLLELGQTLGVEFYTARMILRQFKSRKLVKEYYEDIGRIRVGRFVAVSNQFDSGTKYEEEKNKFMEYLDTSKNAANESSAVIDTTESESEVPRKKNKLEETPNTSSVKVKTDEENLEGITEIKTITNIKYPSMLDSQKKPTLRQLKYANGVLKVLQEKQVVSGTQLLNALVSKESKEPPMDTKNLKAFLQSLAARDQIKIFRVPWPGYTDKFTLLFAATHVQTSDSIIKAKYKEIYVRAIKNMKTDPTESVKMMSIKRRPLTLFACQRYTRLRMLHILLMNLLYFDGSESFHSSLPPGFSSFVEILPEFTVEFAVNNITETALAKLPKAKTIHSMFSQKLADVPSEIFRIFVRCNSLENGCLNNFRLLALCGLLQLIEDPKELDEFRTPIGHVFFVNRRASIIDTTGHWPRNGANIEALRKSYYFGSIEDVEKYWDDVCNISINTTIEMDVSERQRKTIPKYFRPKELVHENDNGQILGNGLGPCGFDASFFMDVPRLWSNACLGKRKKVPKKILKKKKPKPVTTKPTSRPSVVSLLKPVPVVDKEPNKDSKRRKARIWPEETDRMMMLCKAALTVLCPLAQPGCISLRNVVIKYILTIMGQKNLLKHSSKRLTQQESDPSSLYERDCVISELKRRPHLMRKYEGLFSKIKHDYAGNVTKTIMKARVPMLELVWTMRQLMKSKSFNRQVPCVAKSLEDFHKHFTIFPSNVNTQFNSYKTPPYTDPELATLKEGIMQILAFYFKATVIPEMIHVILPILSPYPEVKMRLAIEELHRSGAIASKEKKTVITPEKLFEDFKNLTSYYRLSEKFQRAWSCSMNSEFVDKLGIALEELPPTGLNVGPEVNCLLLELHCCGLVDINSETAPVLTGLPDTLLQEEQLSVMEMQMHYHLKTGTVGWRTKADIKNILERYDNLDIKAPMHDLLRNSVVSEPPERSGNVDDVIVSHLEKKKETGSSFCELQNITGYNIQTLKRKLNELEVTEVIRRLGYFENIIVLTEHAGPWAITIEGKKVIPTPWIMLDMELKPSFFINWAGAVVNEVFKKPGSSIADISDSCEYITTRAVQDICTVLEKVHCFKLKYVDVEECDLFSDDTVMPVLTDFNPYGSVHNILVFPVPDMLTRYAHFRKLIALINI